MNPDDPKLTAYALDELEPAERAEIEALLREQPALNVELEELRKFTGELRAQLRAEEALPLAPEQRAAVLAKAERAVVAMPRRWWQNVWLQSAVAACLMVGAGALLVMNAPVRQPQLASSGKQVRELPVPQLREELADHESLDSAQITLAIPQSAAPAPAPNAAGAMDARLINPMPQQLPAGRGAMPEAKLLAEADGFYQSGRWDRAAERVDKALQLDPHSVDARKLRENINLGRNSYGNTAYNETRSRLVWELDSAGRAGATSYGATPPGGAKQAGRTAATAPSRPQIQPQSSSVQQRLAAAPAAARPLPLDQTRGGAQYSAELTGIATAAKAPAALPADEFSAAPVGGHLAEQERETRYLDFARIQELESNTEAYDSITDNAFLTVEEQPLSTFSIDVDTASYSNVRRFLNQNQRPPRGAVRIEELVNYFRYNYPAPQGEDPFSCALEVATCPWQPEHRLVRIGLKGKEIARSARPAANLVFLIDVSGSMEPENKLPLVKQSLRMLVDQLNEEDTVAIAVYAGASGCVLEPTRDKEKMRAALDRLGAGGSTNGAAGIQLAYDLAQRSFKKGGTNRVILCTDGDFNVGITSQSELISMIEDKAKTGIFLSVLGFGMGNLKDSTLEKLADKGNGNYGYIDTLAEGRRVFVEQVAGTLVTIAKDVKVQVEFNPAQVAAYRLIGYENRLLAKEDFNDDTKDAGEIGAGHTVTALYEVVPAGKALPLQITPVDELKYQPRITLAPPATQPLPELNPAPRSPRQGDFQGDFYLLEKGQPHAAEAEAPVTRRAERVPMRPSQPAEAGKAAAPAQVITNVAPTSTELLTVKLRYKQPEGDTSKKLEFPLTDSGATWEKSSRDFRWAASVASFGMLLRDSPHKGSANWALVEELAAEGKGEDGDGYRAEFVGLIEKAKALSR